jgi:hypothetical protein
MNNPVRSRRVPIAEAIKAAIVIFLALSFVYLFSIRARILVNKPLWYFLKPDSYTMQVRETRTDGVMWLWEIRVVNNETVEIVVLERERPEKLNSILEYDYSVDQLFSLAESNSCKNRGIIDCGVRFDIRYHFPKFIYSYEMYIIEVETFVPGVN